MYRKKYLKFEMLLPGKHLVLFAKYFEKRIIVHNSLNQISNMLIN